MGVRSRLEGGMSRFRDSQRRKSEDRFAERFAHQWATLRAERRQEEPVTIEPGESIQGVLLFITGGGNRPVTVSVTFDDGATLGSWATSMGPS